MGPRFFDRGNGRVLKRAIAVPNASMGPRFFDRGNNFDATLILDTIVGFNGAAVL